MESSVREKVWSVGLVIGKFDPPHLGHTVIIDEALASCNRLIVFVRSYEGQQTPVELRVRWMREIHPDAEIMLVEDDPAIHPDNLEAQAARAKMYLGDVRPEVMYSSEWFDPELARLLGAASVSFDRDRKYVPVSSTMIRNEPLDNLQYLEPVVRAHFVKRVCVLGAECTGKTTLCQTLARDFETNWNPEYGKEYAAAKLTAGLWGRWSLEESVHIAREQQRREDEAARGANKLLFCDTNTVATAVWHELLVGEWPRHWPVAAPKADLYLVMYPDVPYVPSPLRTFEHKRFEMHERMEAEARKTGVPVVVLQGDYEEREPQAREAVERLMSVNDSTLV